MPCLDKDLPDSVSLKKQLKQWALELGLSDLGVTRLQIPEKDKAFFNQWIKNKFYGEMHYMARNQELRCNPKELMPEAVRVISVRLNYMPADTQPLTVLNDCQQGYISRYALGRDYHKVLKKKLKALAEKINTHFKSHQYRTFVDSAPVLEGALAQQAGLGWIGKHTLLITPKVGSFYFLGELFTNLPLEPDEPFLKQHCGSCQACIDCCPTKAIIAPYTIDARRCIAYLTIEYKGSIPVNLRHLMGNRIYGCDDCQLYCPWNKFTKFTNEKDFKPNPLLTTNTLADLFLWTKKEFECQTEGKAIRRAGYENWLRNIAVALGNSTGSRENITALNCRVNDCSPIVREHVKWALERHKQYTH